jgi:hypothetical protein
MDKIWEHFDRIVDFAVVIGPLFLWLKSWLRRIGLDSQFTKTVAQEHLPHVYTRLRRADDALALPTVDHPDIVYVNGRKN